MCLRAHCAFAAVATAARPARPPRSIATCGSMRHGLRQIRPSAWGVSRRFLTSTSAGNVRFAGQTGNSTRSGTIYAFDKVPEKLPDWWDEEEDDDDNDDDTEQTDAEIGGGGGFNDSSSGSGGGGRDGNGGDGDTNSGDDSPTGPFGILLGMYIRAVTTRPVLTKAVSTSVLAMAGDLIAQRISQRGCESGRYEHDIRRTISIGIWGFTFMGPVLHTWYGMLDRMILGRFSVLRKVITDQLLFAPCFNSAFMFGTGLLEGEDLAHVAQNWREKFWESMVANWSLWPAAQMVNFALIPKTFQIVYVNCVALLWNAMLTYISHERGTQAHPQIET